MFEDIWINMAEIPTFFISYSTCCHNIQFSSFFRMKQSMKGSEETFFKAANQN